MRTLALMLILTAVLAAGLRHDFDRPVFVYAHHPDLPISEYVKGRLGIPVPEHARIYLYAAYRYFQDKPFTPGEQAAYLRAWKIRSASVIQAPDDAGVRAWEVVRSTIAVKDESINAPVKGYGVRAVLTRGYVYQDLCADDAFASSAKTLRARIRQFGLRSEAVEFWVKGQDRVFASCDSGTADLPSAAPAHLPALIRADREYQIAAALYYLQRFDEALGRFRSIGRDGNSPWRIWAPYLVGRTLLWQARLTQDQDTYLEKLRQAETQFRAVLADRRLAVSHQAAERLLDRCMLITQPGAGLERLAARLMAPAAQATRESDLLMYLNRIDDLQQVQYDEKGKRAASQIPLPRDDFSLWWETFQSADPRSYREALARWHKSGSKAWLYCAISKAGEDSPDTGVLLAEALKVGLEQPAGPAMRYQVARLLAAKGQFVDARKQLEMALTAVQGLPSARNRALELKFQLAGSVEEMAALAPREVIMPSTEMDADEFGPDSRDQDYWKSIKDPKQRARARTGQLNATRRSSNLASMTWLDITGARVFSEKLPLDVLRRIALREGSLPQHLISELRLAVWTRAVLLGRFEAAREFAPLVASDRPAAADQMALFVKASDGRPAEIAAARVLLKLPGARPYMSAGYGRLEAADKHDEWGRNWWYRFTPAEMYGIDLPYVGDERSFGRLHPKPPFLLAHPPFLTEADEQQFVREWKQLKSGGERGLNWIAIRIAEDVRDHPEQAGGAETLYNLVRAAEINQWSYPPDYNLPKPGLKTAYRLLASRYARSIWYRRAMEVQGLFLNQEK